MTRTIDTGGRCKVTCVACGERVDRLNDDCCSRCELAGKRPPYKVRDYASAKKDPDCMRNTDFMEIVLGKKFDDDKNPLSLLPFEALDGVGLVLLHGAKKYDAHNWRAGMSWSRLISALLRHIFAFARGENIDPESGLPHLDHAACCILFLSSYQKTKNGQDDRFTVEVKDGK